MGIDQERHRPGLLKQQNKAHKHGRHRSKGAIHVAEKGRTASKVISRKIKNVNSKEQRRNQMVQNRLKKRQETLMKKRQLRGLKTPFLVAVIPFNFYVKTEKLLNLLKKSCEGNELAVSPEGILHINVNQLKQKFSFVIPQIGNIYAVLDCLKVADTVLFVGSAVAEPIVDDVSENMILAILAQGLPSTAVALLDLENIPLKKRSNCKQDVQKVISQWLPEEKIIQVDKEMDALNLLRKIGGQKQRQISLRDRRPHLLAEKVEFVPESDSTFGILKLSGYLRGQVLSVNSLIHIPGWGDFQMKQIDGLESHYFNEVKVLEVADPNKQASLMSENIPDPMDAEQTWPTEEEIQEAEKEQKQKKLIKRIPKGMSDYQACWIPEEEVDEVDEDEEDEEDDSEGDLEVDKPIAVDSDDESQRKVRFGEDEEFDIMTITEGDIDHERYDEGMDLEEEQKAQEKIKEAKMDEMFPDEVDTPKDIPARQRFQKYRGLSSFRTSPWDPKENLPYDYARIFQFENFNRTRKRVFNELESEMIDGVECGSYITIHVDKVPIEVYQSRRPYEAVVVFGILEHEQKMSVLNLVLKRYSNTPWADVPIKSKEELLFQCGYRRYKARPIFSEHTNGNKHKYQRYFQPGSMAVATLYAPIIFPPASVLVFKENPNRTQDVVATGNVLSVNPDRLIIKRVVLSGHPFKVNKKSAVIRFMFFNREDINWFKPVELKTKYGRRGHIREPLGTHGHMKTVFDGQLKSQDTVLMFLYKRVFPKWSYDPLVKYTSSRYKMLLRIQEEKDEEME